MSLQVRLQQLCPPCSKGPAYNLSLQACLLSWSSEGLLAVSPSCELAWLAQGLVCSQRSERHLPGCLVDACNMPAFKARVCTI